MVVADFDFESEIMGFNILPSQRTTKRVEQVGSQRIAKKRVGINETYPALEQSSKYR